MEYITSGATVAAAVLCFFLPKLIRAFFSPAAVAVGDTVVEPSESAVLITGGYRGIGRDTAAYLLAMGFRTVFVTVRKHSQYDEIELSRSKTKKNEKGSSLRRPVPVMMDVSNDKYTSSAVKRIRAILQEENVRLVAIVNNAGINPEAAAVVSDDWGGQTGLSDPTLASQILETNVVGVARVTRALLPLLCDGGRIVNIGSYFGSIAGKARGVGMAHAYYECSKFALEGLTDNLRRSLQKEGKYAILIKPGNISTDVNTMYGEVPTSAVAKDVAHAVLSKQPRPRYYPGKVNGYPTRLACGAFDLLPTWVSDMLRTNICY